MVRERESQKAENAVALLLVRFPILTKRVEDVKDLWTAPHFAYSLLATEVLENHTSEDLLQAVGAFIDELADSGDHFLEELLVIDVLEGIAQDLELSTIIKTKVNSKAVGWMEGVELDFFPAGRPLVPS